MPCKHWIQGLHARSEEPCPHCANEARQAALETENAQLRNQVAAAKQIITAGVNLMPMERLSRWGGVRSFLEQETEDYEPPFLMDRAPAKVLYRLSASFEHEGRCISICTESMQDIRDVWEELDLDLLDEKRVQRVFLGARG